MLVIVSSYSTTTKERIYLMFSASANLLQIEQLTDGKRQYRKNSVN